MGQLPAHVPHHGFLARDARAARMPRRSARLAARRPVRKAHQVWGRGPQGTLAPVPSSTVFHCFWSGETSIFTLTWVAEV